MLVLPASQPATIRSVERNGRACGVVQAGDSADVVLQGLPDVSSIGPGSVVCHSQWPVPLAARITARVAVLEVPIPILTGQSVSSLSIQDRTLLSVIPSFMSHITLHFSQSFIFSLNPCETFQLHK